MKTSRQLLCWISAVTLPLSATLLTAGSPDDDTRSLEAMHKAEQKLSVGDFAPHFSGHDQDGHTWKLSHHLGKNIVFLYFYPKDNTAGCTTEACSLRDNLVELKQVDVDVVGVSFDGKNSHKEFAFANNLSFPLLADTDGHIANAYGARMGDKKMDRRVSFLIGLDGRIIHITDSPDPAVHMREMMAAIAKLNGKAAR
jgi:thioredoxin-dependent peroxiredoxin